jgi:8-oxo-dGTP diphosphatase
MSESPVLEVRYSLVVDVNLLLIKNDHILLGQRQNTGFEDGKFHLPSGHLERAETVLQALIREAQEELGIAISSGQVTFAFVLHDISGDGRLRLFFVVREWKGSIQNMEPDRCRTLQWFNLNNLPDNVVPYVRYVIQQYRVGKVFAVYGGEDLGYVGA